MMWSISFAACSKSRSIFPFCWAAPRHRFTGTSCRQTPRRRLCRAWVQNIVIAGFLRKETVLECHGVTSCARFPCGHRVDVRRRPLPVPSLPKKGVHASNTNRAKTRGKNDSALSLFSGTVDILGREVKCPSKRSPSGVALIHASEFELGARQIRSCQQLSSGPQYPHTRLPELRSVERIQQHGTNLSLTAEPESAVANNELPHPTTAFLST